MSKHGGKRENAGRKGVPSIIRRYRIPLAYEKQATKEIKEVLTRYREKYLRSR